jgi:CRP-like cAMP-binding protein
VEFPEFTEAGPLTAFEAEALRTLFVTRQDLRHEYESALAGTDRTDRTARFPYHHSRRARERTTRVSEAIQPARDDAAAIPSYLPYE